jgi:hypothetical protein
VPLSIFCFLIKSNIEDTRNVSLDELGKWLENNTSGQYKLVKNNIKTEAA